MSRPGRWIVWGFVAAAFTLALTGCPTPAPPADGNGEPPQLTSAQQTVIDSVLGQARYHWAALGAMTGMLDVHAFLADGVPLPVGQTCPTQSVSTGLEDAIASFTFGEGCVTGPNGPPAAGSQLVIAVDTETNIWAAFYPFLQLDGREMNGSARLVVTGDAASGLTCSGTVNISIMGVGTLTGDIAFTLPPSLVMTISAEQWVLYNGSSTRLVALADVALDVGAGSGFVPQSGTLTFAVPAADGVATATAVLTFDTQSPPAGVVHVSIDGGEPIDHTLVGF